MLVRMKKYDKENTPRHLQDHALFIAYAPAHKPRIVVAVVVENGGSGSAVAAPVARQVMDAYLLETPYMDHAHLPASVSR